MDQPKKVLPIAPIIKWAGGKKKLAPIIEQMVAAQIDLSTIDTYVEPFAGGASLLLFLSSKYTFKKKVILDINPDLINLYLNVRDHLSELVAKLSSIERKYNNLSATEQKDYYYTIRNNFNENILARKSDHDILNTQLEEKISSNLNQACYFIFLNKTDFNGLYRVNSKGTFNVPFGQRKQATLFNKSNIINFSELLQNTEIMLGDYRITEEFAGPGTFFYFDPPYRPLTDSSSFTSYAKSSFNDTSQQELAKFVSKISKKGAHFALSNSDPHQSDPADDFFDTLYSDFTINRIQASRMISAKSQGRGKVSELLIVG
ncbi:DNA adenine methylase [Levilactobacillus suantsaiihabitans]|uniref:site-specific DNA-methyltransferase (adenine-specific) n=1 Tax=Levilactobacillus suantsaiihabitans TaxID=2487722 RepID=A0A4Z0JEG0_9LACO|nr:Dam family site-specific DNA-(adenine-N6)-methyltransferase [Levilactobacillus suantsaiihabitans]TGD20389.1 Dam family site-specific DNA-(adenine-N6)-methyltransferase [Levilactobacillus suantsaiihabitans]